MTVPAPVRPGGKPAYPAAAPVEGAQHRRGQAVCVFGDHDQIRVAGKNGLQFGGHVRRAELQPGSGP